LLTSGVYIVLNLAWLLSTSGKNVTAPIYVLVPLCSNNK
jgi:hypothetical protein